MKEYTFFLTFFTPYEYNIPPSVPAPEKYMPVDLNKVYTILEFLSQEYDAVRIVGGEPFLVPAFNDIIDTAVEFYKKITIETYGAGDVFRFGYNIKQHISSGADIEILIQMMDFDPKVNDDIVGTRAWENAISAATLLDSTLEITPKIVIYVGSHSTHKYSLIRKMGYEIILRRAYGMRISQRSVATMFQLGEYDGITVDDCIYDALNKGVSCSEPQLILDANGNIYHSRWVPTPEEPDANIFGMTMEDLLNKLDEIFAILKNAKYAGKCARCSYLAICKGGDPLYWESPEKAGDRYCPIEAPATDKLVEAEQEEQQSEIPEEFLEFSLGDVEVEEPTVDKTEEQDIESIEEEVVEGAEE